LPRRISQSSAAGGERGVADRFESMQQIVAGQCARLFGAHRERAKAKKANSTDEDGPGRTDICARKGFLWRRHDDLLPTI
jgi:hypothetical protein